MQSASITCSATRSLRTAPRSTRAWRKNCRLVAAWAATLLVSSTLVWAISWYRPAPRVNMVLVGAAYETNLAVPHNVFGWRSLLDLAEFAGAEATGEFTLSTPRPRRVTHDFRWNEVLESPGPGTVLLYVAAHGAADLEGPYLLPDDTTGAGSERLRLHSLWDALAALPAQQRKIVCFEVTQLSSEMRLGILNNGFARGLTELNDKIASIPNLVVLCASDVNQQSWVCPQRGRSLFGSFFVEGISGGASDRDHNGRINLAELRDNLHKELSAWARQHRGVEQTPLLLPQGAEGRRRASGMEITVASGAGRPARRQSPFTPQEPWRKVWERYDVIMQQQPAPYAYAPAFWREYVDTLVRYDQLARAGETVTADSVREALTAIEYRMLSQQYVAQSSLENSLACYTVAGSEPLPLTQAQRVLDQLEAAEHGERVKIWAAAVEASRAQPRGERMLRLALLGALWQRTADDPSRHLPAAEEIIAVVRSPLQPLPAEIHFLSMLAGFLPAEALSGESLPVVQQALRLRQLAEQAAVGSAAGESYTPQRCLPWIEQRVKQADVYRRYGEDLLFAGPQDRLKAADYFARARREYEQALADAQRVQHAFAVRDRVFALLPYYASWLADIASRPQRSRRSLDDGVSQVTRLWEEFHRLGDMLADPDPRWIEKAPPPSSDNRDPLSLVDRSNAVQAGLETLIAGHRKLCQQIAGGDIATDWQAVERALQVPHRDWQLRERLAQRQQELVEDEAGEAGNATADNDAATGERLRSRAIDAASSQGKLALAMQGRALFLASHDARSETYEQVEYRLAMASVEPQWWKSVAAAGTQILQRWEFQPILLDQSMRQTSVDDPHDTQTAIAVADRVIRQLDGAQASRLTDRPDVAQRRFVLHMLANFLAERSMLDRWHDQDSLSEPYFRRAALAYLSDAQRLYPDSPQSARLRQRLATMGEFQIANVTPLVLTSGEPMQLEYDIETEQERATPAGYPVSWLNAGNGLELIEPTAGQRVVRLIDEEHRRGSISFAVRSPALEAASRAGTAVEGVNESEIILNVFFRGQMLRGRAAVWLHPVAEIATMRHPLPSSAALSVTAPGNVRQRYGSGSGAIAFVLDCSGSMGPPRKAANDRSSKYTEAVAALTQVLDQVPAGTQVSVWAFGQAHGPQRTTLAAESTIQCVQPPVVWNPGDRQQLPALLAAVDPQRITPWNQSPIVRTILAAKGDVEAAAGFRSIVVITDGMDNRFAADRVANPAKQSIPAALTAAFDGAGISLNIVGFKVVGSEATEVQRQFSVVKQLHPPGRFDTVDHVEALAAALGSALRQTLRFHLEPYDAIDAPPGLELGQAGGGEVWPTHPLAPGSYRLNLDAGEPVGADVTLGPGDVLALSLEQGPGGMALVQKPYAPQAYRTRPFTAAGAWRATALQNQATAGAGYRAAIGLERSAPLNKLVFAQATPSTIWFEIEGSESAERPGSVSWRPLIGYPLAAWDLSAQCWPLTADQRGPQAPRVRMWWTTDRTLPFAATMRRIEGRADLRDLAGTLIEAAEESVRAESVEVADHYVEVAPGRRELRSCLVIRLRHAPGKVFWAEPLGLTSAGAEQRFYPSIGRYTGLFWPVTSEEAQRRLQGFGVVALDAYKQKAEQRGNYVQFNELPQPDPNDMLPTPAYTFK